MEILQEKLYDQDHIQFNQNGEYRIRGLSNNAIHFVDEVQGQLSDGMWENSPVMENYWRFFDTKGNDIVIKRFAPGTNFKYCGFADMNELHIKEWFANKIKAVVKEELKYYPSKGEWDRNNDVDLDWLDGTLAQAYAAYDELKSRKDKNYGQSYKKPAFYVLDIDTKCGRYLDKGDEVKELILIIIGLGHKVLIKNNITGQVINIEK